MTDTCIVQLGRIGDVLNMMPLAAAWRCAMMVHDEYAEIVRGCSAIHVETWTGSLEAPIEAASLASERYGRVLVSQLFGRGARNAERHCEHYCLDEWHRVGALDQYGKWPLYFDRRDAGREERLFSWLDDLKRPMLLISLAGISGPYRDAAWLREEIVERWGKRFNIVDLSDVGSTVFYDLLGLYDRASLLLTIDTSTLHLAAASKIKAIELLSYEPESWHGSTPKGNCVLSMRYAQVRDRIADIHTAIAAA